MSEGYMPFSLIIFDYDGVLIDSLAEAISAGREFCRVIRHDRVPTPATIGALEIMTYPEIARSVGLTPAQVKKFCAHVFERFEATGPAMKFFPEMESLLHRMAARNLAIVSGNARNVISAKLAAHGLAGKIGCILGGLEPGDKAQKIRRVCNHFGVAAGQSCMVGDSVSDIRSAKQAGVQAIAATWGWQARSLLVRENPDFIVNSVQELAALLDAEYSTADHRPGGPSNG
jgi:phosphoglycolate phosphatase-like HAD superfamily hydrolase